MYKKILAIVCLSLSCAYGSQDDVSCFSDVSNEFGFESFRAIGDHLSFDADNSESSTTSKISYDIQRVFYEHELDHSVTMDCILTKIDTQLKRLHCLDRKIQQLKKSEDLKELQKINLDKKNK